MIRGINSWMIPAVILFLASCGRDVVYTDTVPMKDKTWELDNIPDFNVRINDTSQLNDISFTIRTGSSYPFRNLYLFVSAYSPDGRTVSDTIEYKLADEKGNWFGKGFGDIHELSLPYRSNVYFPVKGSYRFKIRHGMRIGSLTGVYDFGLRIVKTEKQ